MAPETPYGWLADVARADPDRVCVVTDDVSLTYRNALHLVDDRILQLADVVEPGEIVPVQVANDAGSMVELLAIQEVGGVPLPRVGDEPSPPVTHVRDAAICVATSGSGSVPKIVPISHGNIGASVHASRERLGNTPHDRWLAALPLNHIGGLSILWRSLEAGGSIALAPFDPTGKRIEAMAPTFASMVPTMVYRLLKENPAALASIGTVLVGGAALDVSIWDRAAAAGVHLAPTYGMTETTSQVATLSLDDRTRYDGFAGRPLDGFTVTIVDAHGNDVEAGISGNILVDGPAVFAGYLGQDPIDRPFATGDVGRLSADGALFVEGRQDDMIVTGGENVSLGHVASVIAQMRGVRDVCVVSLPDDEWGAVVATMVVADHPIDVSNTTFESSLARHEHPKQWLLVDEIPTLPTGKHDVTAVRAALARSPQP